MSNHTLQSDPIIVMLKPDVFLRQILNPTLAAILDEELKIFDYKCGRLCNRQFHLMYSSSFSWGYDHWAHNKMSFEFGPVLGLLIASSKYKTSELLERFNQKKGSALPFKRDDESIRFKLNSKSRIFNILHIPNNENEALEQGEAWFGRPLNQINRLCTSEEISKEIESHGYLSELCVDPEYTFVKVKKRLVHSLEKGIGFHNVDSIDWAELKMFYEGWSLDIKSSPRTLGIEGTILSDKYSEEIKLWHRVQKKIKLQKATSIRKIQIAELLLDLYSYNLQQNHALSFFFEVLSMHRVFLTSLEEYLIRSRFIYPFTTSNSSFKEKCE